MKANKVDERGQIFTNFNDVMFVAYVAEKIRLSITNLLSNALKFTLDNGNIYIHISQKVHESRDKTTLELKLKDTGIGIQENQIEHIFDRFYQIVNTHNRKEEGSGIGLSLTKELVRLMHGTVIAKSQPVSAIKGTEFIITTPLQKQEWKIRKYLSYQLLRFVILP